MCPAGRVRGRHGRVDVPAATGSGSVLHNRGERRLGGRAHDRAAARGGEEPVRGDAEIRSRVLERRGAAPGVMNCGKTLGIVGFGASVRRAPSSWD
jgi:hypothetical protein